MNTLPPIEVNVADSPAMLVEFAAWLARNPFGLHLEADGRYPDGSFNQQFALWLLVAFTAGWRAGIQESVKR